MLCCVRCMRCVPSSWFCSSENKTKQDQLCAVCLTCFLRVGCMVSTFFVFVFAERSSYSHLPATTLRTEVAASSNAPTRVHGGRGTRVPLLSASVDGAAARALGGTQPAALSVRCAPHQLVGGRVCRAGSVGTSCHEQAAPGHAPTPATTTTTTSCGVRVSRTWRLSCRFRCTSRSRVVLGLGLYSGWRCSRCDQRGPRASCGLTAVKRRRVKRRRAKRRRVKRRRVKRRRRCR